MDDFRTNRALIARLQAGFAEAQTHGNQLAESFYRRLFSMRPDLRPMFTTDAAIQQRKVMDSLAAIVGFLDNEPDLDDYLAELGARHADYGATAEHYEVVINALAGAFVDVLGPDCDPELIAIWRDMLGFISERMMGVGG